MTVRRVYPEPGAPAALDELYGGIRHRALGRPWVGLCMITSLDGTTVVDGRSGGLGNPNDTAVLGALRRRADVILVGAATVREEGYGPPRKAGQRIAVVTSTGDVDPDSELFSSGAGLLIMPEDGPRRPVGPHGPIDTVRAGSGRVDLPTALQRLDSVIDAPTFVQAEGGPRLNGSLLDADCVDELNLTIAPALAGGAGPRVTSGAAARLVGFELAHVLADERCYLYTRWIRRHE